MANTDIQEQQKPILMICSLNDLFFSSLIKEGPRNERMLGNKELGRKPLLAIGLFLSNSCRSENIVFLGFRKISKSDNSFGTVFFPFKEMQHGFPKTVIFPVFCLI